MKRILATICAGLILLSGSGCGGYEAGSGGYEVGATCVDWVRFDSVQAEFDDASLVVVGKPVREDGTTRVYGYEAQAHLVDVERVLKGDAEEGTLRISSMPQTCGEDEAYPEGDPLDTGESLLIFARDYEGDWYTLTPTQGVHAFDPQADLPFDTTP